MKLIRYTLLLLVLTALDFSARASHIYGADFFYEAISKTSYRISLVVYGDCVGMRSVPLNNAAPQIIVLDNGNFITNLTLFQMGPGVEVTPVCPAQRSNTACASLSGTLPGVMRFTYSAVYNVPYKSSNWLFRFQGTLSAASMAGRSSAINNIATAGGSVITLEAQLNNSIDSNSSPRFTTIPTPFSCINVPQQYNQGAVDPQNDSLVYSLAPGLVTGGTVTYNFPFTATAPLATAAGTFSFSSVTGQLAFTPNAVQTSLVVNKVTEYRNGVIVGTAYREMTFIVLTNCNSNPAVVAIDTVAGSQNGGVRSSPTAFNSCFGTDSMEFRIVAYNPAKDTLDASVNGLPPGAVVSIVQNNTPDPVIYFKWKPSGSLGVGTYNFFVTLKDKGCPLSSQQTQAYSVQVFKPNEMSTSVLAPTQCVHQAYVQYNFYQGLVPRLVTISQGGNVVRSYTDNTGSLRDSLPAGNYTVTINSPNLPCSSTYALRIVDSGIYPHIPQVVSPLYYCTGDKPVLLRAPADSGAFINWYGTGRSPFSGPPLPQTDTPGIFTWYLTQRFKVCESLDDSITVFVTKRPVAHIAAPDFVCLHDTATISFDGTVGPGPQIDYLWRWEDPVMLRGDGPGPWRVYWSNLGRKTVKLQVIENNCPSDTAVHELEIRPVPYAGIDAKGEVCLHDTLGIYYNSRLVDGQQYTWTFAGADTATAVGPGPFQRRWRSAGTKEIGLIVGLNGCYDTGLKETIVRPLPPVRIGNAAGPACIGDQLFLTASGGVRYAWSPADSMLYTADGRMYAQILKPSIYRVTAASEYGCIDSTAIAYSDVQPCCNFTYPNAFSPNGDGRNDRFRVLTHGNHQQFELSIFNNWGQRVFYGLDPEVGWDGRFDGKPCDAGTYFFYVAATCFTGHKENQKGSLMLVK